MNNMIYKISGVKKHVHTVEGEQLCILNDITCEIEQGVSISITGASGSGKSTLLHLLGLLDIPTAGVIEYKGVNTKELRIEEKALLHRKEIGFIFQFHHLLPEFTSIENVALHARLAGYSSVDAEEMAYKSLEEVGLVKKAYDRITTLSGGEKQRVSIARAIVTQPSVILADEPTGSLDTSSAEHISDVLLALQKKNRATLILVTHNMQLASMMEKSFVLDMGVLRHA